MTKWTLEVALFALLAIVIEWLLWCVCRSTPVYKRHLCVCVIVMMLSVLYYGLSEVLYGFIGAILGLSVSSLPYLYGRCWLKRFSWQRDSGFRRDPTVPLVLVADPHWRDSLVGLKEVRANYPGADWLFLGDLFDVWVGIPGNRIGLEIEFLNWVKEARASGAWVGLWVGNREFFLDYLSDQFDLIGEGVGGRLEAEGLCWEHGDLVNGSDWRYRLWNLLTRSAAAWVLARFLPNYLVSIISRRLRTIVCSADCRHESKFPHEEFVAAATEHYGETFVTGHFHTYKVCGNGVSLSWAHDGKFMVWHNGSIKKLDDLVN